jgi:hypothetical protein
MAQDKVKLYGQQTTSKSGDVGPNGSKLMRFWGKQGGSCHACGLFVRRTDKVVGDEKKDLFSATRNQIRPKPVVCGA